MMPSGGGGGGQQLEGSDGCFIGCGTATPERTGGGGGGGGVGEWSYCSELKLHMLLWGMRAA